MVLLAELLFAAGIVAGVYRLATRPGEGMAYVEPDRSPADRAEGPLTADDLVAVHIPMGFGYRKVDVDRLLDRVARQLPRAVYESEDDPDYEGAGRGPFADVLSRAPHDDAGPGVPPESGDRVSLAKEDDGG